MSVIESRTGSTPRFNPLDPAFIQDPHPVYERLRREAPFLMTLGTRVLTRHADVVVALKDRRLSVSLIPDSLVRNARKLKVDGVDQAERFVRNSIVFTDKPEHVRLRRLVGQAYAPAVMETLRKLVAEQVEGCLDAFDRSADRDFVRHVARPLPVNVLCAWIGVPASLQPRIGPQIHVIRRLLDPGLLTPAGFAETGRALASLTASFVELGRDGALCRPGGLLDALRSAQADGDRLGEEEVAFACIMSFVAGTETSEALIGNLVHALVTHPDQQSLLREEPGLLPRAVQEAVRHETPLQLTKRWAPEELEIEGQRIRAGEQLLLCLGSANRDEQVHEDPHRFDVRRTGPAHVGFGTGMHGCLGAGLARLVTQALLAALLERHATLRLQPGTSVRWQSESLILRALERLPLECRPC